MGNVICHMAKRIAKAVANTMANGIAMPLVLTVALTYVRTDGRTYVDTRARKISLSHLRDAREFEPKLSIEGVNANA